MSTALINLDQPAGLPAHLQGLVSSAGQNMVVGGMAFNRIGLKGSRFRLIMNGQEEMIIEDHFLDVIIVGASPGVSRLFYEGAWDPEVKTPPTCYSVDGTAPPMDLPTKQSLKCQTCVQNQIGSRIAEGGRKTRACGFFKRLAVVLPHDPTTLFRLEAKGMTIFSEGKANVNKFSLAEYGKKLNTRGIDPSWLITRLSFNTDESVPVVLFSPTRYLEPDETAAIQELINSEQVNQILEISMQTVDLSGETANPEPTNAPAPAQAAAQAPPPVAAAPVATPPPVAAPAPAAAAPAVTRAPAVAPVVTRAPAPAASPPIVKTVIAAPAVGKAMPPRTAPVAAAVAVPTHAPPATVEAAAEQSDDEGLAALIARLGE